MILNMAPLLIYHDRLRTDENYLLYAVLIVCMGESGILKIVFPALVPVRCVLQ